MSVCVCVCDIKDLESVAERQECDALTANEAVRIMPCPLAKHRITVACIARTHKHLSE